MVFQHAYSYSLQIILKKRLYTVGIFGFMCKQPLFSPEAAGISNKVSVTANYAVAGNDNRNPVPSIGSTNCPDCFYVADVFTER